MRRLLLILALTALAAVAYGQQRPLVTQYNQNNFLLNPALSGLNYGSELRVGGRAQYNSALENPPETYYLTGNFSLRKRELAETHGLPLRGKSNEAVNKLRKAAKTRDQEYTDHHGIGFVFLYDRFAYLSTTTAQVTYAYHHAFTPDLQFSFGAGAGATQYGLNVSNLHPEQANDLTLSGNATALVPEVSAGVWLAGKNFFAGMAGQQLAPSKWTVSNQPVNLTNVISPHVYTTAGYKIEAAKDLGLVPSVMLRNMPGSPLSFDLNLTARYQDRYWLGSSYRIARSVSFLGGLYLTPDVLIGYSYDLNTNGQLLQAFGAHELVLGYNLRGPMHKKFAPNRLWN